MKVSDVADRLLAATNARPGLLVAARFVAKRYRELASRERCRHLRRTADLLIPAVLSTGTITTTAGSTTVTGDSDAVAAWDALGQAYFEGKYLLGHAVWYEIETYNTPHLILKQPYSETTALDEGGYRIVGRYIDLPADLQWLGNVTFPRLRRPLPECPSAELNLVWADRLYQEGGPQFCSASCPPNPATGLRRLELYPYSPNDELIRVAYWATPLDLRPEDDIPQGVEPEALENGAKIDLLEWLAFEAAENGEVDKAGYYRNEAHAQRTKWETLDLRRALDIDSTGRDKTMLLRTGGYWPGSRDWDPIHNARQDILSRWPGF